MKVRELIEELEAMEPEAEVRLAHQPSWPLAFTLAGVVDGSDLGGDDEDEEDGDVGPSFGYDTREDEATGPAVVWLVEGTHPWDESPYAPRAVWDHV